MRIIINADDLGISEPVNDAIFSLLQRNRISSATLIANGPAIKSAARKAKHFPDGTFGVHLNASEFSPLTNNPGLRPLLRQDGQFRGNLHQVRPARDALAALKEEWFAQINRLKELGLSVGHIDSHHHVHTIPALFPVLKAVQRNFGIRRVRSTVNLYPRDAQPRYLVLAQKWIWAHALRNWYRTTTPQFFSSFAIFHARRFDFAELSSTIELMTHPGSEKYTEETELLESDWWREVGSGVKLIRYPDL